MNGTFPRLAASLILVSVMPGWCFGQTFSSYADGKQFSVDVWPEDVTKAPQWKADDENPPLSARKALKLANAVREQLVQDDDDWKWIMKSVQLTPTDNPKGGWFWLVCYEAQLLKGSSSGIAPNLRLAVLMDGTVPKPDVGEWKNLQWELTKIAKKEATSREGWPGELKVDLIETKDGWDAKVWRMPKTPGGFVVVTISTAKKVTAYRKGK